MWGTALQLLGMEQPFRVVAPCTAPQIGQAGISPSGESSQKSHTPTRPTAVSRFKSETVCILLPVPAFAMPHVVVLVSVQQKRFSRLIDEQVGLILHRLFISPAVTLINIILRIEHEEN